MKTHAYNLSIILVSYNVRELLKECLTHLFAIGQNVSLEVIVVDNGSHDGTKEMVAQSFPKVKVIRSEVNIGFGRGNNLALDKAQGKYFVLLNTDAFPKLGSLERAYAYMESHPQIGIGGAKLINEDGTLQLSVHQFPSLIRHLQILTGSKIIETHSFKEPFKVDWVPGPFLIIRPQALKKIGSFDPRFYFYYEEVDICKRCAASEYEVWHLPDVEVIHLGGKTCEENQVKTFSKKDSQVLSWADQSMLLYFNKHYGTFYTGCLKKMINTWQMLRYLKNRSKVPYKAKAALERMEILDAAWESTKGGTLSPPQPWP